MTTIGSLFSGIGGLELGLERAGLGPVVWQAESDPFCRRVLAKHWPGVKCYDDVRQITAAAERPDIICGGFPCQDISTAGRRAGIEGKKSGLWTEFARIVGELQPRIVVVENVSALLVRGMERVLGDLSTLGYDAVWDCIPAAAVGAPHRRDRVYIIAHAIGEQLGLQSGRRPRQGGTDSPEPAHDGAQESMADADGTGCGEQRWTCATEAELASTECSRSSVADPEGGRREANALGRATYEAQSDAGWSVEPDVGRVAHGVPSRAHRLRALGNAVVPQVAEVIGRAIVGGLS